jgi:hypothetical protein
VKFVGEETRQYREPQRDYHPEPFWMKYNATAQRALAMESAQQPKLVVKKDLGYLVLAHQRRS